VRASPSDSRRPAQADPATCPASCPNYNRYKNVVPSNQARAGDDVRGKESAGTHRIRLFRSVCALRPTQSPFVLLPETA
jgi:hypothetical protein